jgi:hypothetical protein
MTAIRSGLDYLVRTQLPSGEFPTFTGPDLDLHDAVAYPKSVYVNSFVIHSLGFLPTDPRIQLIQERAAAFLEAEEETSGVWNYEGRCEEWRLPPELDSTCCAAAALVVLGRRSPFAFYPLLWQVVRPNAAAPGGPYYTYVGVNDQSGDLTDTPIARDIDPLVNANVLFCAGLLGIELPGVVAYLENIVRSDNYRGDSFYVISPHFLLYAITRAYADGAVAALAPSVPAMRDFLTTQMPHPVDEASAFNIACRAVSLLNLGADPATIEPLVSLLLETQGDDGGWPIWAAWAGFPPNYDGSPALTIALALEAIGKWLGRNEGTLMPPPDPAES